MNISLFETIKENWFEMLIMCGVMYGVIFGVILGLIFFGTAEKENHLPIWSDIALSFVVSGLIVLGICSYIIIQSMYENEAQQHFSDVRSKND